MNGLPTRHLVLAAILGSVCVGMQLTPRFPNVEFTSLIVFVVGALFGGYIGASLGILVMLINGFFSPWGFAGFVLPFQVIGMILVGIIGGLYKRTKRGGYDSVSCIETAILGAFLTLVYDIITNFGVALSITLVGTPMLFAFVSTIISGTFFSLIHIISNTVVFGLVFLPLTKILQVFLGGENLWKKEHSPT